MKQIKLIFYQLNSIKEELFLKIKQDKIINIFLQIIQKNKNIKIKKNKFKIQISNYQKLIA